MQYKCVLCFKVPSHKSDINLLDSKENIRKGPFIFYQEGGLVVLHAFIDNFVMTPQQMQENFQWPPFYSTFSSHDPPPPMHNIRKVSNVTFATF